MSTNDNKKFDVGILGWWYGKNYGSMLTYYGLNRAIEGLGYNVLMVHETLGYDKWRAKWPDNILSMQFARRVGYNTTKQIHYSDLDSLNDQADTFLVGSDQLWNPLIGRVNDDLFLSFVRPGKKRIAYATSFGNRTTSKFKPDFIEKHSVNLKRFDAISVRETYGKDTARDIFGVEATQVTDPAFLLSRADYEALADNATTSCEGEYLATFFLDPTPDKMRVAEEIAKKLGFEKILVIPNPDKGRDHAIDLIKGDQFEVLAEDAPENFLNAYRNADYIITDSFHGTVFSVMFEKPFSSIYNTKRGVDRFLNLKSLLGLGQSRRIRETDTAAEIADNIHITREIDLSGALKKVEEMRANSLDWLREALAKPAVEAPPQAEQSPATRTRPRAKVGHGVAPYLAAAKRLRSDHLPLHLVPMVHLRGTAPQFQSNSDDCKISHDRGVARIQVPRSAGRRGNHIWCDLPGTPAKGEAWRLKLHWSLRTKATQVNLHLRNPQTGTFKVIGKIAMKSRLNYSRHDIIDFVVPGDGMSQFMLGALHFSGKGAEAQVVSISLEKISHSEIKHIKPDEPPRAEVARQLALDDHERFIGGYASGKSRTGLTSARARMMFHSHAIEKGLSHADLKPGFGRIAVPGLAREMNGWMVGGRSTDDVFFQTSASVMRAYFERHREIDRDVSHFRRQFDDAVLNLIGESDPVEGGVLDMSLTRERPDHPGADRPFMDVVYGRRSVREFTDEPVDDALIRQATQIAMQAPSVCNRQSGRVHVIDNEADMQAVLKVQGGFGGYAMPPKLLLVTSDLESFLFVAERNQPYIDGGLFMMTLLLGLTQMGLGSCSLNTAMNTEREAKIRKRLGISDKEVFIAFIAVGHYDPKVLTPRSKRLLVEDVIIRH